jgi:hypothetical protein
MPRAFLDRFRRVLTEQRWTLERGEQVFRLLVALSRRIFLKLLLSPACHPWHVSFATYRYIEKTPQTRLPRKQLNETKLCKFTENLNYVRHVYCVHPKFARTDTIADLKSEVTETRRNEAGLSIRLGSALFVRRSSRVHHTNAKHTHACGYNLHFRFWASGTEQERRCLRKYWTADTTNHVVVCCAEISASAVRKGVFLFELTR